MSIFFIITHHAVVRDIAPDQAAIVADIDRTFRPSEPIRHALDSGIAYLVLESLVEDLDPRVGIAPIGKIAKRERARGVCLTGDIWRY